MSFTTKRGITKIKFPQDTYSLRKILSIIILIVVIVGYTLLVFHISLIFYSFSKLKVEQENFEYYTPNNNTIILEGDIVVQTEMEIRDLYLNFSLYTDTDLLFAEEEYEKDLIKKGEANEIAYQFVFEFIDMTLEDFLALNATKYVFFKIYATLNYGGIIFELYVEFQQDVEVF